VTSRRRLHPRLAKARSYVQSTGSRVGATTHPPDLPPVVRLMSRRWPGRVRRDPSRQ
jgi:hypothetical protein